MENVHRICTKEVVQFYHSKHLTTCACRKAEVNVHLMTNMYGATTGAAQYCASSQS